MHSVLKAGTATLAGVMMSICLSVYPQNLAEAATLTEKSVTVGDLTYRVYLKNSSDCILRTVYTKNNANKYLTNKTTLTLPDTLKIDNKYYRITELGYNGEAIIHNHTADSSKLNSLRLPTCVEKINSKAIYDSELSKLNTLELNLKNLNYIDTYAFGSSTKITDLKVLSNSGEYISTNNIYDFERYLKATSAVVTPYRTETDVDLFILCQSPYDQGNSFCNNQNAALMLLDALAYSPYSLNLAYDYAVQIAEENKFTDRSLSKQVKLELIWNYLKTSARYSALYSTQGYRLDELKRGPLGALALHSGTCRSLAIAFEMLCRASGLNVTDNPATSDVVTIGVPGHAFNAVRLSASEGYYIVDCTTDGVFMKTEGYKNNYGMTARISYTSAGTESQSIQFAPSKLASKSFCEGNSFVRVDNNSNDTLSVQIYDSNKPSCKFINYFTNPTTKKGVKYDLDEIVKTENKWLYVSSYSYFTVKVGGQTINTNGTPQTVTIGGVKYKIAFKTLNYGAQQEQASAYQNYYNLVIEKA